MAPATPTRGRTNRRRPNTGCSGCSRSDEHQSLQGGKIQGEDAKHSTRGEKGQVQHGMLEVLVEMIEEGEIEFGGD